MSAETVILAEHLTKTYRDFWGRPRLVAVDGLSLEVARGEIFGIIGPNGCGKTTTMKMLLGLLRPTGGRAQVLGRPPDHVATKRRIGFLPEESYLYPFLSGQETLDFYGKIFRIPAPERRRRIDALLERFEMSHARRRRLKEYSKGMVRRISFAQALINDPEVLFLDEPTSGLDPISSVMIKRLTEELRARGKTIFLASHLLADVQSLCDRIAILDRGQRKVYGPVKQILARREHVSITFKNLSEEARRKVEAVAAAEGAQIVRSEPTLETLEDLFVRTVGPSSPPPPDPKAPPP
jgi:ABC-2 type transport system ATP-binding protein